MFTLREKLFLLQLLKSTSHFSLFKNKQDKELQQQLIEKLEQMVRNEQINQKHL